MVRPAAVAGTRLETAQELSEVAACPAWEPFLGNRGEDTEQPAPQQVSCMLGGRAELQLGADRD